ncbi:MAG: acyl-CoA dehydrogenase [Candidatus Binatia bacterium]|jgi:alkylation response protein AidB-like acyl-CoA dehydrogenase|nr:acyl-CoA dehydrogenase [Candidatus Binatia bacterium]MDG2011740.1 acyl-CoA dehydrogenase [Candidatus Binatia bacterium]
MNFGFTEEQEQLRESARRFLDDRCPITETRKLMLAEEAFSPELWAEITALGWPAILVPEAQGGLGLHWLEMAVLLEETGRTLAPSPLLATALATATIIDAGSEEARDRWLPEIAAGNRTATLALLDDVDAPETASITLEAQADGDGFRLSGMRDFILDAGQADVFVIAFRRPDAAVQLAVVEKSLSGVSACSFPTVDPSKRLGRLTLDNVVLTSEMLLSDGILAEQAVARALDRGAVAVCAESIGAAESALNLLVEYAKTRMQFGAPIGKYQGVKHPLAEIFVDIESFRSLTYYAAWAIDESPEELPRQASLAKAYVSDAMARIGIDSVQLHGAIGYTEEYDAQLFLKRAKWVRPAFGDADWHYERAAALGGL